MNSLDISALQVRDKSGSMLNGTFDNKTTMTRQVFQNGLLGLEIPKIAIPFVRDGNGRPMNLVEWGSFPDYPGGIP